MFRGRLLAEWFAILILASAAIIFALSDSYTERFNNLLYDPAATVWAASPSDRILIVEIDNASLDALGKWQWNRDLHARGLAALAPAKPAAVAYDVLFLEPSVPAHDAALGAAIKEVGSVIFPVLYTSPGANGAESDITKPIPEVADAVAGLGSVNLLFDDDGLVRRAQLETRSESGNVQHLMEMTYRQAMDAPSPAYKRLMSQQSTLLEDESDSVLIPFQPTGSFRHVSFSSVVAGEVPAEFIRDKIVLIGGTADGMGDIYSVAGAAGSTMSGVEIMANQLNAMINDRFIRPAPFWASLLFSLIPAWVLMVLFLRWRPAANLVASLVLLGTVVGSSFVATAYLGISIPPGPALLGLLVVYPLWGWRRLATLSRFVAQQASAMQADVGSAAPNSLAGLDSVANEALQLRSLIGELGGIRRFMSAIVTGFPDPICVMDKDRRVILANSAALDVLGQDSEGQELDKLIDRSAPGTAWDADEMVVADGRIFLIRNVSLLLEGSDEHEAGAIVRFVDISRIRNAEREREEMLEFLSHDMRSPQAAIINLLETEGQTQKGSEIWKRVHDHARKTLQLADGFVQHARLVATELKQEEIDPAGAMAEAIDAVWTLADGKGIKIESEGLDTEAYVLGEFSALVRSFTNLLDNAVKYSSSGSRILCRVELDAPAEPKQVRCTVSDQGAGVSEARMKDMFARFGAVGEMPGSGLGMSYVKTVVDRMGGTIEWTSAPGQGTSFTLSFPIVEGFKLD